MKNICINIGNVFIRINNKVGVFCVNIWLLTCVLNRSDSWETTAAAVIWSSVLYGSVQRICNISSLRRPISHHFIVFMTSLLSYHYTQLSSCLERERDPFPKQKTSNIDPTPNTEMHLALSFHFNVEMLIRISHHGHITKECRMVIYFYHIDISFFRLHLRQLKRSWNTILFVIFICFLFYLEKSWRGIGILFISFLFDRSFSLPPTCL
jgi:hypothetical protein